MNENAIALLKVLQDEAVAEKVKAADSIEAVLAILAENGYNATAEELKAVAVPLNAALNSDDELSEDSLDMVAGGVNWWKVGKVVVTIIGAICDYFK